MSERDRINQQCIDFGRRMLARNAAVDSSDISGFSVFSDGDLGSAHVMAHELLDAGRHDEGRRRLGAWLESQDGAGSEWVHLQWHMALFELATGRLDAPLDRFRTYILPAVASGDALTDAPSLLWRFALAGVTTRESDRRPVREVALSHLGQQEDPYIEVHNLLALGVSEDTPNLDRWLGAGDAPEHLPCYQIVRLIARGLRSFVQGDFAAAGSALRIGARAISWLGGSHGQNMLFEQLRDEAWRRGSGQLARMSVGISAA